MDALRRAASREPSCERTWREMWTVECGKMLIWRVEERAFAIVDSSSWIRLVGGVISIAIRDGASRSM